MFSTKSKSLPGILLAASLGWLIAIAPHPAPAQGSDVNNSTIVFVCLHGSVKSQVAAAHFNKVARERGLPYTAISRGIQIDNSIPAGIRDGLSRDGLAPTDEVPHQLTTAEASRATRVVAFDAVPDEKKGTSDVTYWSDVPPATKDYTAARTAITRHIDELVSTLAR